MAVNKNTFFKILLIVVVSSLSSCKYYKQHYMFRYDEDDLTTFKFQIDKLQRNYVISENDILEMDVFTHDGERIIDPEYQLQGQRNNYTANSQQTNYRQFRVLQDSTIKLPLIGHINLVGMTLDEAETYLQTKYDDFYTDPFVKLRYSNKRVIVLGATGGQIIFLEDEKITLLEILANAGGIDEGGKAGNIRVIRGDLNNPEVFLVDLSTIKGMRESIVPVEPGDIVYVEPTRKIVTESLRDFTFVLGTVVNVVTMIVLLNNL